MRSSHSDYFNHDDCADEYDEDVLNESDPIRTGYDALLDWVAENSGITKESRVLELGSGTGNLTLRLPESREITCVDVSEKMETLLLEKITHSGERSFIKDDVLAVFDRDIGSFDSIVSTYTVHHLTKEEKKTLFKRLWSSLNEEGVVAIGDLMIESAAALQSTILRYRKSGHEVVAEALEEEFFWHLRESIDELESVGFSVEWKKFSDLSYGIVAKRSRSKKSVDTIPAATRPTS